MRIVKVKSRIVNDKSKTVRGNDGETAVWKPEPAKGAYYVAPAEQWSDYEFICSNCGCRRTKPTNTCPDCKRTMFVGSLIM